MNGNNKGPLSIAIAIFAIILGSITILTTVISGVGFLFALDSRMTIHEQHHIDHEAACATERAHVKEDIRNLQERCRVLELEP